MDWQGYVRSVLQWAHILSSARRRSRRKLIGFSHPMTPKPRSTSCWRFKLTSRTMEESQKNLESFFWHVWRMAKCALRSARNFLSSRFIFITLRGLGYNCRGQLLRVFAKKNLSGFLVFCVAWISKVEIQNFMDRGLFVQRLSSGLSLIHTTPSL